MALNIFEEIKANKKKTKIILFFFFLFIVFIGTIVSIIVNPAILIVQNQENMTYLVVINFIFLAFVIGYVMWFYSNGDKMILKTTGAKPVSRKDYPKIYHSVEILAIAGGMKKIPDCYVINDTALNAYATGVNEENSHIVLTSGIIDKLTQQELEGVIAHELAHIKNGDMKYMLICAGVIGVFQLLGTFFWYQAVFSSSEGEGAAQRKMIYFGLWLLFTVIAPFFAILFKLAISRKREFLADATGAQLTRYPKGLADALEKIRQDPDPLVDNANKATAHLFISTPFRNRDSFFTKLFATHPPIQERIDILNGKKKNY